ncbi:MAG: TonB-dependent receptor plug domain-containing protein, partial [Alcanivorax sp.]|nr:TonB-dependent receptor plug domain-containing protein [Alcanivorax sp.]
MMPLADEPAMVLTPARVSQPQSEAPASVTVIDRNLIEASGARELYEVLRLVPGMSAVKVDGNVPTVAYHGTQARDSRRMLVLLDGRSQYQPGLARVNWNDMPVDIRDVERIEVTRGPAAAAYGANAFTAVINIITRDPRDISKHTLAVQGGNNAIRDGYASAAGRTDGGAWRASLSRR